jgi:hypothetical protein
MSQEKNIENQEPVLSRSNAKTFSMQSITFEQWKKMEIELLQAHIEQNTEYYREEMDEDEKEERKEKIDYFQQQLDNIDEYALRSWNTDPFVELQQQRDKWINDYESEWKKFYTTNVERRLRKIAKNSYTTVEDTKSYVKCDSCHKYFRKDCGYDNDKLKHGYCCASWCTYIKEVDTWVIDGGYGSIVADFDSFKVDKLPTYVTDKEETYVICDACLLDLAQNNYIHQIIDGSNIGWVGKPEDDYLKKGLLSNNTKQ